MKQILLVITFFAAMAAIGADNITISNAAVPVPSGNGILFTFKAENAHKVYIAGSFNNWADNDQGKVTNPKYEMERSTSGIWYKVVALKPKVYQYKFVVADDKGNCAWSPDPLVPQKDKDDNSILDCSILLAVAVQERSLIPGRQLEPLRLEPVKKNTGGISIKDISLEKVWVQPGETNRVTIRLEKVETKTPNTSFLLLLKQGDRVIREIQVAEIKPVYAYRISTVGLAEGGYLLEARLTENGNVIDREYEVLSVVNDISDDLRYGFYANWKPGSAGSLPGTADYDKKSDFFARLHINGIEYYDYFPAHGNYAPREKVYQYEPFGIDILGEDVQKKIDAAKKRNILSIAYIAAYASSKSVYEKYPYPMTTRDGIPRIFNGNVMNEQEAKQQNKDIWFYLMAIGRDTKWYPYIMEELKRCMDDSPDDIVSFDGFEIDSYGHSHDDRYYSADSKYSGQPLRDVIRDFVSDVRDLTHKEKSKRAVSFNCVNEYGIENMYDVTDFLFIENWSGFKSMYEDLVDICYNHRARHNQRVIIKIYPANTKLGMNYWPAANLRYVMAATMTGAGSLMVAGEPDESAGEMHGLNTLYYPDNVAIPAENFAILKDYYLFDALLYRVTHGKNVQNLASDFAVPGCITRSFRADNNIVVNILHNAANYEWSQPVTVPPQLENYEIAYQLPDTRAVQQVFYGSPDFSELLVPQPLDFEVKDGYLRTLIPKLSVFGTLIIAVE